MNWMEIGFWIFVGITSWVWVPVFLVLVFIVLILACLVLVAPFIGLARAAKFILRR